MISRVNIDRRSFVRNSVIGMAGAIGTSMLAPTLAIAEPIKQGDFLVPKCRATVANEAGKVIASTEGVSILSSDDEEEIALEPEIIQHIDNSGLATLEYSVKVYPEKQTATGRYDSDPIATVNVFIDYYYMSGHGQIDIVRGGGSILPKIDYMGSQNCWCVICAGRPGGDYYYTKEMHASQPGGSVSHYAMIQWGYVPYPDNRNVYGASISGEVSSAFNNVRLVNAECYV